MECRYKISLYNFVMKFRHGISLGNFVMEFRYGILLWNFVFRVSPREFVIRFRNFVRDVQNFLLEFRDGRWEIWFGLVGWPILRNSQGGSHLIS